MIFLCVNTFTCSFHLFKFRSKMQDTRCKTQEERTRNQLNTRYSPLTTLYSLLFTHYSLLTTLYSLLFTHYSLLTTLYSLLFTHYSLLFTQFILIIYCSTFFNSSLLSVENSLSKKSPSLGNNISKLLILSITNEPLISSKSKTCPPNDLSSAKKCKWYPGTCLSPFTNSGV